MPTGTAHNSLVAVIQTHNKVMATAVLGRLNDFFVRCALVAHTNIFHDGGVEQVIVLRDIGNVPIVVLLGHLANIHAAERNTAAVHIPQSRNEFCNGGFPAARRTNEGVDRAFPNGHVDAMKHLFLVVAEGHVMQRNIVIFRLRCGNLRAGLLLLL